ncbi:uncharacterized protein LOC133906787 [Phragmites australis]|uniref:uncharacterized protein LOC133906787 n=1 Tax=Phragmites australis TaxID=29695 RepID=UPI002D7890B8|nr:uncharacterized protein LOC133906787 [Phragmites australis]
MARIRRTRRRSQSPAEAGGKDRLSALPDDLLRLILCRLDTRTALSTAVLARRWAHLSRELPALEFTVFDVLPTRYLRTVNLRRRARARGVDVDKFDAVLTRCELRATRAFIDSINSLLKADGSSDGDGHSGRNSRRRAKSLRLVFFPTDEAGCVDKMIATAVGEWGVEDLEVAVCRTAPRDHPPPAYSFPDHLLDDERHRSRLRALLLGNCELPPLHRYGALQELVLQYMAASTPMSSYDTVFNLCGLQVLHLICCRGTSDILVVSAPGSGLRELVVESCSFQTIELRALPELGWFACLGSTVELQFGAVPRLTHVNLRFSCSARDPAYDPPHHVLGFLLGDAPAAMTSLVVRFTGPRRWIVPRPLDNTLHGLRELLVADVPSSWDVSWPRLLLEAAPALEVLYIHVAPLEEHQKPGRDIQWQSSKFRHSKLRDLFMVGFTQAWRQIRFLRYLVKVCEPLEQVFLLRDWHIEDHGFWDWRVVKQREYSWSEVDQKVVERQIKYGRSWSKPHVNVFLE